MFGALVLWLGGGALYLWLIALIFLRYTFLSMSAEDLTPPYWINMGAVAISTLAGARLLSQSARSEEHTSELQSLMRISYAVFCLKKKKHTYIKIQHYMS